MNGWINLNKEIGVTSLSCVKKVKRILNVKKAGHLGTLDPLASGVLPIAIGEATKVIPYINNDTKQYEFEVQWGEERTTGDLEGDVSELSELRPTQIQIESVLDKFIGDIQQVPPVFSAIKVNGVRSYDLARAGNSVPLPARMIKMFSLKLLSHNSELSKSVFLADCGSGTYVRSLARDIGRELGCLGYALRIKRTRNGDFNIMNSCKLEEITQESVLKVDFPLVDMKKVEFSEEDKRKMEMGAPSSLKFLFEGENCANYYIASRDGIIFAICKFRNSSFSPVCVFKKLNI